MMKKLFFMMLSVALFISCDQDDDTVVEQPEVEPIVLDTTCDAPSGVLLDNVTDNSATIQVFSEGASSINVEYGVAGFTVGGGTTATINNVALTIDDLESDTTYDFYLQSSCTTENTDPTSALIGPFQFTTGVTCPAPSGVTVSDVTASTATVSFMGNSSALAYAVEYGETGFIQGEGTVILTSSTTVEITDLDLSTTYDLYITTNCGGSLSESSEVVTFSTSDEVPPPAGVYLVTQITPSIFGYDTFDPDGGGVELTLFNMADAPGNTIEGIEITETQAAFDADYLASLGFGNTMSYVIEIGNGVATFSADPEVTGLQCAAGVLLAESSAAVEYNSDQEFTFIFLDDATDDCGGVTTDVELNFVRL